jgi:valyl-tRNA synthetase
MELMDKYGTDAVRFTIVYLAPLGNDVLFDEDKTQIGRNFITKLWNAGRFLSITKEKILNSNSEQNKDYKEDLIDAWIASRYSSVIKEADRFLKEYRLNDYTKILYNFVWSDFCDWYIELIKIKINKQPEQSVDIINNAINFYENILKVLHPVIPFITEELWHIFEEGREDKSISFELVTNEDGLKINNEAEIQLDKIKDIISSIRNLRVDNNILPSQKCEVFIKVSDETEVKIVENFRIYIMKLSNLDLLEVNNHLENKDLASTLTGTFEIFLSLDGNLDIEKQMDRINKQIQDLRKYLYNLDKKLSNENFLKKASDIVVENEKRKRVETTEKILKLQKLATQKN